MRPNVERRSHHPLLEAANDMDQVEEVGIRAVTNGWLSAWRRYASVTFAANLAWEFIHAPLYTLWRTESSGTIVFSVLHCTAGDLIIGGIALLAALVIAGHSDWPHRRFFAIAGLTILFGLGYTLYSEWSNVYVRQTWAYTEAMPLIFGIGLTPILQWLIVPTLAFFAVRRGGSSSTIVASGTRARARPF
jgi:hypothetical protein